ncbi:MAG: Ig-like domain-containing protein [Candidatus Hodarchaeales archaeon]
MPAQPTTTELDIQYNITRLGTSIPGYGIQGLFTVHVSGPAGLLYVEFYMDNLLKKNDTESPFNWQYNTDEYKIGSHTIKIVGYSADDSGTKEAQQNFITLTDPVFLVFIGIIIVIVVVALVFGRGRLSPTRYIIRRLRGSDESRKGEKELWGSDEDNNQDT